jgi:hypothetical protein
MEIIKCDSCGKDITDVADGWVEWISFTERDKVGKGLRVVHKNGLFKDKCQYNQDAIYQKFSGILNDNYLENFVGPDGLMRLLVMISESELPTNEVLEMIKRLHISGYDQAREHFEQAIRKGIFEPNMPKNFYNQSDIEATINSIK